VYEILRLRITNTKDEAEFREYRLDVKRRLNIPYQVRIQFHIVAYCRTRASYRLIYFTITIVMIILDCDVILMNLFGYANRNKNLTSSE
jgi:hypothetical protein